MGAKYKTKKSHYTAIRQSNYFEYLIYMKFCKDAIAKLTVSNNSMIKFLSPSISFNVNALSELYCLMDIIEADYKTTIENINQQKTM